MAYDSRGPNPFLELDVINQRWRDLAIDLRDARDDRDRKRINYEMDFAERQYRAEFAKLEEVMNEYRLAPEVDRSRRRRRT